MTSQCYLAESHFDADPLKMNYLMSSLSLAPSDDEEQAVKFDLVLTLWSHLSDEGKARAWNDLLEIRRKADEWSSDINS